MADKKIPAKRRELLKTIAAGSGVVIAGKSLPDSWRRPVVDAVMLPAHARTSARRFSGNNLQASLEVERPLLATAMQPFVAEASAGDEVPNFYIVDACAEESGSNLDVTIQVIDTRGEGHTHEYKALLPISGSVIMVTPVDVCPVQSCARVAVDMSVVSAEGDAVISLVGIGTISIPPMPECLGFSDPQCPPPPINCLAHNTPVLLPGNRQRVIDALQVGDLVSAMAADGSVIYTVVTKVVTEHLRNDFYTINGKLQITDDHPVLVERELSLQWCRVDDLMVGDRIRSVNDYIEVTSLDYHAQSLETVYLETQCGNFIAVAGSDRYVVKSTYAEGADRLQQGEHRAFA